MADFDYKTAWQELAAPAFDSLPQSTLDLLALVNQEAADLHQQQDLTMPWPNDAFKAAFDAADAAELAYAARVIYFHGHWHPGKSPYKKGEYWKLMHYADQSLNARLGLPVVDRDHKFGVNFKVIEGLIRAQFNHKNGWMNEDLGLATEENLKSCRPDVITSTIDNFEKRCKQARKKLAAKDPLIAPWLDKERFMIDKSPDGVLLKELRAVPAPPQWCVKEVTSANHRLALHLPQSGNDRGRPWGKHPFCIGQKHMENNSGSIMLDPRCAPCDICGYDFDKHISDKIALLEYSGDGELPIGQGKEVPVEVRHWLVALKEANQDRVEGFGFVKEE